MVVIFKTRRACIVLTTSRLLRLLTMAVKQDVALSVYKGGMLMERA